MTDFQLSDYEKSQPLWHRLKAHLEDRLAVARVRNDDAKLTEFETAALRGEIKCLKQFIRLDASRPILTGDNE